jgi:two-component system sensor histidine kinase UhpB
VRIETLRTVTRSALQARQRQYELRDHLLERTLREEALRQATQREQLLRSRAEQARAELALHRDHLEELVADRTVALSRANNELKKEVAERRRAEAEKTRLLETVTRQKEELRALTTRLADLQESERFRLARELHDQVGQSLSALGFNLSFLQAQCETEVPDKEIVKNRLADSLALIEQTTDRVREVLANLRPPVLDDYGLGEALQWYAGQFTNRIGLPVTITDKTKGSRLGSGIESTLFRIVQEALTNTAKHAGANRITISLKAEGHLVRLDIVDDGIGFDFEEATDRAEHPSLGLLIMAERAMALDGRCWVESEPGQGTRVIVELPQALPQSSGIKR